MQASPEMIAMWIERLAFVALVFAAVIMVCFGWL